MNVFISYAHADEPFLRSLLEHLALLRREGKIDTWHDREIAAGEEWRGQIDQHLQQADLVLCLVSSAFVASDYCWDVELREALARHQRGEARLVPIIVRPVSWQSSSLGELQALPTGGKPVASWHDRDAAWLDVEQGLRALLDEPRTAASPAPAKPPPEPPSRKTLAVLLAALATFAALLILILAKIPKATTVVITATVDELVLTVQPRRAGELELLHENLQVGAMQLVGARSFAANLRGEGRVETLPSADAAIGLRAAGGTSFHPRLGLRGETRLRLRPEGPGQLMMTIESRAAWECQVPAQAGLRLRLRDVELAGGGEGELESAALPILFTGAAGRAADLGLRPVATGAAIILFAEELNVRAPTFFRFDAERDSERGFLRAGMIRFQDDVLPERQLESGSLLELRGDVSYRLKSLSLAGGALTVVLAGKPSGISLGPRPDLMRELLPSTFAWLGSHRLALLAFSTLGGLLTLAVMLSKLLGWVKDG